jgi:hypothetical protein
MFKLHRMIDINSAFRVTNTPLSDSVGPNKSSSFMIVSSKKSFQLYSENEADKNQWLEQITECMQKTRKQLGVTDEEHVHRPVWKQDGTTTNCPYCRVKFTMVKRRHHCRKCGNLVCGDCSKRRFQLTDKGGKERVCDDCAASHFQVPAARRKMSLVALQQSSSAASAAPAPPAGGGPSDGAAAPVLPPKQAPTEVPNVSTAEMTPVNDTELVDDEDSDEDQFTEADIKQAQDREKELEAERAAAAEAAKADAATAAAAEAVAATANKLKEEEEAAAAKAKEEAAAQAGVSDGEEDGSDDEEGLTADDQGPLPAGWLLYYTDELPKTAYYYHEEKGTVWERPTN